MEQLKENNISNTDLSAKTVLVLLSGGQDSVTCLAWALKNFKQVECISFDYGQRHKIELECAEKIAKKLNLKHKILSIDTFQQLAPNALTHDIEIASENSINNNLPNTFVPGRNLIFLTFASAYAYSLKIEDLVTGVCQTDYSGYPDCRENTMQSLQNAIRLGMESNITLHTPLMHLTKAETVKLIKELGFFELLKDSHTCYNGKRPACGKCKACLLRLKGFAEANEIDPLQYAKLDFEA